MPRLLESTPRYRKHNASGQAVVTLSGKDFYLGPHGTKTSKAAYDRLLGEWLANGRCLPRPPCDDSLSITELSAAYLRWAQSYYVKHGQATRSVGRVVMALRLVKECYSRTPIGEFGPLALQSLQRRLIDRDLSRSYCNDLIGILKHMFKWGVSQQLVPVAAY